MKSGILTSQRQSSISQSIESNNLSDLTNASTARDNLELGNLVNVYNNATGSQNVAIGTIDQGAGWYVFEWSKTASKARALRNCMTVYYNPNVDTSDVAGVYQAGNGESLTLSQTSGIEIYRSVAGAVSTNGYINRIDFIK